MFQMTMDVFTALKETLTDFKEQGISKIQLEKVIATTKHIEDVAVSLNEVDSRS